MGIIRGILFVITCVLLLVSLLATNTLLTIDNSLDYNNIKPELEKVVKELLHEKINLTIDSPEFKQMQIICENNSDYSFENAAQNISISCETIAKGPEAIIQEQVFEYIDKFYYAEYDCDFWDCKEESDIPFYLVSQKAKDYWHGKFKWMLTVSFIIFLSMLLIAETRSNAFIVGGILTIISAFPFLKLEWLFSKFSEDSILSFFTVFISSSTNVFTKMLILGIILILIGIIIKFFKAGFYINSIIQKIRGISQTEKTKEIPNQEIKKSSPKNKAQKS